jgi:phage gp29-like protein
MATSRILGPDGQPIAMPDLAEPQTARLVHLQRELQSHPTRGLTPSRLAKILDAAENGDLIAQFELFEDMEEKDGHIAAEMGKRRRACVLEWDVVPREGADAAEKRAAAQLGELLTEIPDFEDVIFDLTDAIGKGYACLELEWHRVEGFWVPKTVTHRPQGWFVLHRGYRQELRLRSGETQDGVQGVPLTPFGWLTHVHKAKSGYLERAALFRQLVWTYLFKNYSVGDLAEFLEIYGIPLRIGKYPASATEKEKLTLLRALGAIGHNAAGIIPDGMLIEFENAATGDPQAFELMIDWCEKNQSKVILGGTLTSGADGKSSTNALGNVHNEVRKDLRDGDVRQANTTLTRDLVFAVASLNGLGAQGGLRRVPQFRLQPNEREDLTTFGQALPPLVNLGVRPTVAWVHERLGIPVAQNGEAVLQPSATAAPTPAVPPSAAATATAQLPVPGVPAIAPPPPPVQLQPRLASNLAPAVGAWIDQVRDLVARAQSLAEIRDGLDALLPGMTLDQYAAAMALALRAAEMAGRYEVLNEAGGP